MEHDSLHSGSRATPTRAREPIHVLEELSPAHILHVLERLENAVSQLAHHDNDEYLVDEYTPKTLAGDLETVLTLQPQFRRMPAIIDRIIITGPSSLGMPTLQAENSLTSPAANTAIATIGAAVPGVSYVATWAVDLDGTVSASDVNNFQLRVGSTTVLQSVNDGVVGHYPQDSVQITIPPGGANVVVRTGGTTPTTGAVYSAQLVLNPVAYSITLQLGDRIWPGLEIPATGVLEISTKNLILQPQHVRQLTASQPGQYSLELIGRAGFVRAISGGAFR